MDNKRLPTGVRPKEGCIEIWYILPGRSEKIYEYLAWTPSDTNLKKAGVLRRKIIEDIKIGAFNPQKYFPDSRTNVQLEKNKYRFFDYAQQWLDLPDHDWTPQSKRKYKQILNDVWIPSLHDHAMENITYFDLLDCLESAVDNHKETYSRHIASTTYNNWLTCVRGPFQLACKDPRNPLSSSQNPTLELTNKKRNKVTPDPFTHEEAEQIIADIEEHEGEHWARWFGIGFFSGIRVPSELNPLIWGDVNFKKRELAIHKKWTPYDGIQKGTKTGMNRIVYLNDRLLKILQEHKERNKNTTPGAALFLSTNKEPNSQRKMWIRSLQRLGIRYRNMYHMRHTHATLCLMAGMNPAYVALQLGHSTEVFFSTYTRWINTTQNKF